MRFKKQSAFTLFEIMVVLMVIGLTIGIISISTNSLQARNELQPFVDNLYQKITNLEQEAMLKQTEFGLSVFSNKIDVLSYKINNKDKKNIWEYKKTFSVPSNITLKYEVTEPNLFIKSTENSTPEIIVTSGGYVTPFKLIISHPAENCYYIITAQFSGEISLEAIKF
ncbi:MAG: type II secretion system protein [Gammaproteobacteria bacterium]|nr:type II secretion system protein [Gammaproteobacteria bacterium]